MFLVSQTIEKQGFAAVRMDIVLRLPTLETLSDTELVNVQKLACLDPNAPAPSIETILHAVIPYVFVDHTHADAVCAVTNSPNGETFIREIYGDKALVVPYCMPGFVLAKEVKKLTVGVDWSKIEVIILLNHGIFTWGNDAKSSYKRMVEMVNRAEDFLKQKQAYFDTLASGHESREKFDPVRSASTEPDTVGVGVGSGPAVVSERTVRPHAFCLGGRVNGCP
jgi:rhamnose utilization protein RhaD (predicted bifunctional aldolase and dehydrogenase)